MDERSTEDQPSPRFYGTDSTDEYDTLVEATVQDDGTIHLEAVIMDKTIKQGETADRTDG